MQKRKIEYLDITWNPIAMKCTPVSEGCANCWHLAMAKRLAKNPVLFPEDQIAYGGGAFHLDTDRLKAPLLLKKPSRIGVQFMGDLFHKNISAIWIEDIFNIMVKANHHTYFLLTKRPKEARSIGGWIKILNEHSNLWLGVSVENQRTADERIPILLQIPAAKRWVNVEPMLGKVDLSKYFFTEVSLNLGTLHNDAGISWVVCGGETGPKARPMHPDWVRSLRDQCQVAGALFFFKGWGKWAPTKAKPTRGKYTGGGIFLKSDGTKWCQGDWWDSKAEAMEKMKGGKAGHLLDEREYLEIPK